jgi:lipoprotein-anchoring transpeptidase ErfK/SrfK
VTISRRQKRLRLYEDGKLVKSYRIGVGTENFPTPTGSYSVLTKEVNPAWHVPDPAPWAPGLAGRSIPGGHPENMVKSRWLGFATGYGIHGTTALWRFGVASSAGCIRMSVPDVEELFERVEIGTPVFIGDPNPRRPPKRLGVWLWRALKRPNAGW